MVDAKLDTILVYTTVTIMLVTMYAQKYLLEISLWTLLRSFMAIVGKMLLFSTSRATDGGFCFNVGIVASENIAAIHAYFK